MTERGLHILSLDNGGVSVLSELLIVKELMTRIAARKGLQKLPRPCERFCLIGGTGTGGLAAILLGRLKLDIHAAIECWLEVMRTVFAQRKWLQSGGAFSATVLEQVISQIVGRYCGKMEEKMIEAEGDEGCKVVVYAMTSAAMRGGIPTSIRTYRVPNNQGPQCTIVEAVRATMATPGIFKPKIIVNGGVEETYVGGGLGHNNPTSQLLTEVELVYPGRLVASVISVGSGQVHSTRVTNWWGHHQGSSVRLLSALETITRDCETVHQEMNNRFYGHYGYYRFNVEQGIQDLDEPSSHQISAECSHTRNYLQERDTNTKLDNTVTTIINSTGTMMIQEGNVIAAKASNSSYLVHTSRRQQTTPILVSVQGHQNVPERP